ncbi:hypothetical protein [Flavobacterium filum]|uniref:hypothetical protein n=1 Tax=Flavobacterium filum TaxID=370974 RepID=UPI0023F1A00F|nr:hypothetical protein [Flavobacterium filum]
MPGEGSMLHALISSRNNKRNRIDKLKRMENTSYETTEFVDHVQATPELLESIREKMLAERKLEQKKLLLKVGLFLIMLAIVLYVFNYNWKWIEGFFYKVK